MVFVAFCILLLVLFFLSQQVTRLLSRLFMHVSHSQSVAVYALSFLFLPGVILHELSHLLVASILLVPTGEVEFVPEIHGSEVKMGSVAIGHTDPLRRFLIGIAPVIGGLGIMLLASGYLLGSTPSWQTILLLYIVFQVTNTMFSSRKDMEGALGFGVGFLVLVIVLQLVGVSLFGFVIQLFQNISVQTFFLHMNFFLFIAVGIDGCLVLLSLGLLSFRKKHY